MSREKYDSNVETMIDSDQQDSDLVLYAVVLSIVVGFCMFIAKLVFPKAGFGAIVIVPSMLVGLSCCGVLAMYLAKKREAREANARAQREKVAEQEMQRKLKAMKKDRFEKGL